MTNANDLSRGGAGQNAANDDAPAMAVIGAGSIGVRLATAFLLSGFKVALSDPDPARR